MSTTTTTTNKRKIAPPSNNTPKKQNVEILGVQNIHNSYSLAGVLIGASEEFKNKLGKIFRLDLANSSTYNLVSQVQYHVVNALKFVKKPVPVDGELFKTNQVQQVSDQLEGVLSNLTMMISNADKKKKESSQYPNLLKSIYVKVYTEAVTERTSSNEISEANLLKSLNQYISNTITQIYIDSSDPPFPNIDSLKEFPYFCSLSAGKISLQRFIDNYSYLIDNNFLKGIFIQISHQTSFVGDVFGYINSDIKLDDIMLDFSSRSFILSIMIPDTMPPQKLSYIFKNFPKVTIIDWGLKQKTIRNGINSSVLPFESSKFDKLFSLVKTTSFNIDNIRSSIGTSSFFQLSNFITVPTISKQSQILPFNPLTSSIVSVPQGFNNIEISSNDFIRKSNQKNDSPDNYFFYPFIEIQGSLPISENAEVTGDEILNNTEQTSENTSTPSFSSDIKYDRITDPKPHPQHKQRTWPPHINIVIQKYIYKNAYKLLRNKKKGEISQENLLCFFIQYSSSYETILDHISKRTQCQVRGDTLYESVKNKASYTELKAFFSPYEYTFSIDCFENIFQLLQNQSSNSVILKDVFNIVYDDMVGQLVVSFSSTFDTLGLFTRKPIRAGTVITAFYQDKHVFCKELIPEKHKPEPFYFVVLVIWRIHIQLSITLILLVLLI
uniref:G-1 product n=1 Tax=Dictyostelium discoideum TaxID=44689 RepID=Q23906_DICDI|nr:G-1 product [Dictyostelium discoideum]